MDYQFLWHIAAKAVMPRTTFGLYVLDNRFRKPSSVSPNVAWLERKTAAWTAAGLVERRCAENLHDKPLPHAKSLTRPQPRRSRVAKCPDRESIQRHVVVNRSHIGYGNFILATMHGRVLAAADHHIESLQVTHV